MEFVLICQNSRAFAIGPRGLGTVRSGYKTISAPGVYKMPQTNRSLALNAEFEPLEYGFRGRSPGVTGSFI